MLISNYFLSALLLALSHPSGFFIIFLYNIYRILIYIIFSYLWLRLVFAIIMTFGQALVSILSGFYGNPR